MSSCFCDVIPQIDNSTHVLILQHPRERFHAFNTARIVRQSLANCAVLSGYPNEFGSVPSAVKSRAALLCPGPASRPADSLSPDERPDQLVVLDGTWHHARTMLRDIPWLKQLPQLQLNPEHPSRYRIRRAPSHEALSTVEATVEMLRILEPQTSGFDSLLMAFDTMIERQLAVHPSEPAPRHRRRGRTGPVRNSPASLLGDANRLVLACVESATLEPGSGRTLLSCLGCRIGTGDIFSGCVRPLRPVPREILNHMEVDEDVFAEGLSMSALRDGWNRFLRPNDALVCYHPRTLRLLSDLGSVASQAVALKSLDFGIRPRPTSLAALLSRLGVTVAPAPVRPGRAGRRLAEVLALVEFVRSASGRSPDTADGRSGD